MIFVWGPLFVVFFVILFLGVFITPSINNIVASSDKVNHFLAFFVFSFLLIRIFYISFNYRENKTYYHLYSFVISVCYGCIIELLQHFNPARTVEFLDIVANSIGTIAGLIFFSITIYFFELFFNSKKSL